MTALLKGSPQADRRQCSEHAGHPLTGLRPPTSCQTVAGGAEVTGVTGSPMGPETKPRNRVNPCCDTRSIRLPVTHVDA